MHVFAPNAVLTCLSNPIKLSSGCRQVNVKELAQLKTTLDDRDSAIRSGLNVPGKRYEMPHPSVQFVDLASSVTSQHSMIASFIEQEWSAFPTSWAAIQGSAESSISSHLCLLILRSQAHSSLQAQARYLPSSHTRSSLVD